MELPSAESPPLLTLTDKAIAKVKLFADTNSDESKGKSFRVAVMGGGCSGFQYQFLFDEKREDDYELEPKTGVKILVDPMTLPYVKGSILDYTESFGSSGFVVKNPNATGSCGCGTSFSVS